MCKIITFYDLQLTRDQFAKNRAVDDHIALVKAEVKQLFS